ncbi:MAG: hypothetical protein WCX28_07590 [Bacteriovoracaceae bacterium]|nr:hypothetical protein [Bacteroidota bacterium]
MARKNVVHIVGIVVFLSMGLTIFWMLQQSAYHPKNIPLSDSVMAVIGESYVTTSELRQAFETAHPVLRQGNTSRDQLYSVLSALMAEKILAQEASRLGFQTNIRIKQLYDEFQRNIVVEHVIASDVDSRITVSNDEANQETVQSLVSFKFRYWMEPTQDRAERVRLMMQKKGYASAVQQLVYQNPEMKGIARQLESDYVRWTEIEPKFYEAIKTLPIGDISVPIEYDGAFYLLQIVDIRRGGMTTTQLVNSIPTSKKIIFARKRMAARKAYVAALMEPKNVRTNAVSLNILANAATEWYGSPSLQSMDLFTALEKAGDDFPALQQLKKEQLRVLVTTTEKQFSIAEIARLLPLRKIMKEYTHPIAAFAAYTAATVRDHYLQQIGNERNYQKSQEALDHLRVWNEKWLYEEYRLKFTLQGTGDIQNSDETTVRQYIIRKDQNFLIQKIDSFIHLYRPQLNWAALDTLNMQEPIVSRNMPVSFVRGGMDVPAFPTVGNEWKNDISKLKNMFLIQQRNNNASSKN